jgi:serine/threonine protein kinase
VSDDSDTPTVTIVDFGSAKQTSLSKMNVCHILSQNFAGRPDFCDEQTLCGTVGYIAPEVTKGPYGCKIDVFGFGMCLLFMFLFRSSPELNMFIDHVLVQVSQWLPGRH